MEIRPGPVEWPAGQVGYQLQRWKPYKVWGGGGVRQKRIHPAHTAASSALFDHPRADPNTFASSSLPMKQQPQAHRAQQLAAYRDSATERSYWLR